MNPIDTTVPLTSMKRWTPCDCRNGAAIFVNTLPRRRGGTVVGGVSGAPVTEGVAVISVPDPRVDQGVRDVDQEADHHHDQGEERDQTLHADVVAVSQILQQPAPEPGPTERLLGEHRASE